MTRAMTKMPRLRTMLAAGAATLAALAATDACAAGTAASAATQPLPWMSPEIMRRQAQARDDAAREAVARERAHALLAAMSHERKLQQLTGSRPEILPELPECFGGRHVSGIAELAIPTFRITNGPVGLGQNDCVARSVYDAVKSDPNPFAFNRAYTHPSSAKATALPSAMSVAASFDPAIAATFGDVIATEMHNLALHVFEAPGVNLARLPILGRNFEYFGEDPFLSGTMAVAEIRAVQKRGLIAMAKHFVANEQETNRQTIQETVDQQTLRELYLLPFEMAVKDGDVGAIMCAYNYVNASSSCESKALLTDVLRTDWGFTGYVQSDFFAMKSTVPTLKAGMDHEMPLPQHWRADKVTDALAKGAIMQADIDTALERRYTQMFKAGIFDRPLVQTAIDFTAGGARARRIGTAGAVLLQNNGALPLAAGVRTVAIVGKASQVYAQQAVAGGALTGQPMGAGGGSSDVVPHYTVPPVEGLRAALGKDARVMLVLVDDDNANATLDGASTTFDAALERIAGADAVVMMAGTISEEGADRATFAAVSGKVLAASAAEGTGLDWYADKSNVIATTDPRFNPAKNSRTLAMIERVLATAAPGGKPMATKSVLVLKDNAGIAVPPALVSAQGPALLEVWFPGQEDGNIVADLLTGKANPGGKLPVTMAYAGKGFLDSVAAHQFPGVAAPGGQTVDYSERLDIGYRWYDANAGGGCAQVDGRNPCVAFPFGHGLSYTSFTMGKPRFAFDKRAGTYTASVKVKNTGKRTGSQVVQAYVSLPQSADKIGARQPPRRLAGFGKVELAPGRSATVRIAIDPAASNHPFSVWSEARHSWVTPPGEHGVFVGTSSAPADLVQAGTARF